MTLYLQIHQNEFNVSAALYELYQYAVKYNAHVCRLSFSLFFFFLH